MLWPNKALQPTSPKMRCIFGAAAELRRWGLKEIQVRVWVFAASFLLSSCNGVVGQSVPPAVEPVNTSEFLGTFTTDAYPRAGCYVAKAGSLLFVSTSGFDEQPSSRKTPGYLEALNENEMLKRLAELAKKEGFNAVLGYQFDVHGGFTGYGGSIINGSIGLGAYRVVARGTPAVIKCS